MKQFILAILVCVSMCIGVVGCGSEAVEETSSSERAASVSNSNLKEDSSVIAVGKTTVSYKEYKTYYYFMKNQYESILGTDIWKYNKAVKDKSVGQEAIESVLRQIIQVKVIGKEAAIEKVQLATDEKEEADYRAKTVFDSIPAKDKQTQGIELKVLSKIFEENKLAQKMYNVQMGKLKIDYAANTLSAAKVELIYQAANAKNKETVKNTMSRILSEVTSSQNSFYTVAKNKTQADAIEYVIGNQDSRTNLAKAVVSLKKNQTSALIEEKDGFYIAHCIQTNSAALQQQYRNQLVSEKQTESFQKIYKTWSDKFDVKVSKALLAAN